MDTKPVKKNHGRTELKKFFLNGEIPSENHFEFLIESTVNKVDDGFEKDEEGLHISPSSTNKRLMTLYEQADESSPFFLIGYNDQDEPSLQFQPYRKGGADKGPGQSDAAKADPAGTGRNKDGSPDEPEGAAESFFFHQGGRLGVGMKSCDRYGLQVKGYAAMEGRMGTYQFGKVPANAKWQDLPGLENLRNCNAFEIVARAGRKGSGKFAILHAIALCAHGPYGGKIKKTSACYGFYWNKLSLRWAGKKSDYRLQLCTRSNYGKEADGSPVQITYSITKLWEDKHFLPKEQVYPPYPANAR